MPRPQMQIQGYELHINNAESSDAFLLLQKIEEAELTRLPQPSYFHDIILYDFFLFEYSKKELEGRNYRSENEAISAPKTFLKAIPIRILSEVFEQWIARLQGCTASGGEYA
jgi:hypothetical protein